MEKQEHQPVVILISGYARAGKDTVADCLENLIDDSLVDTAGILYTGITEKFATPLYDMLYAMLGDTEIDFVDGLENHKNDILPFSPNGITIRKALQTLGTEWGRDVVGEGIWANLLCARINGVCERYADSGTFTPVIIVSDHRFVSEANVVREAFTHVFSVYVSRIEAEPQIEHRSEQDIIEIATKADFVIVNNYGLEELKSACKSILRAIFSTLNDKK